MPNQVLGGRFMFSGPHLGKKGISIPIAIIAGGLLVVMINALSFYSFHEMGIVKSLLGKKTTEYAAHSGLMWVYSRLCKGRWYQPSGNALGNPGQTWKWCHKEKPSIFPGDQKLEVSVWVDEIASTHSLKVPGKKGELKLLDHIKVIALGRLGDETSLVYGKFIVSPEPILNSDSTEGQPADTPLEGKQGQQFPILVPNVLINAGEEGGADESKLKVIEVRKPAGSKVKKGEIIAVLASYWVLPNGDRGLATQRYFIKAPYDGAVLGMNLVPGQDALVGSTAAPFKRDPLQSNTAGTLKKMVRITRIPLSKYQGLNLDNIKDRYVVYQYIQDLTSQYIVNYASVVDVEGSIESSFSGAPPELTEEDALKRLGAGKVDQNTDIGVAGKRFVNDLLSGFFPPGGLASTTRKNFPKNSEYLLGVQPSEISPQLKELLELIGPLHGKNYIDMIQTRPRKELAKGNDLYKIASTTIYDKTMDGGQKGMNDPNKKTDSYIDDMTWLADGAKSISVLLNEGTPWEDQPFKDLVAAGTIQAKDYFWWPSKKGWYKIPSQDRVTIKSVPVPYTYENGTPGGTQDGDKFRMRVDYLLGYFKKHYDEGIINPPADELRAEDDITDEPQAPGPPDVTGARLGGISS